MYFRFVWFCFFFHFRSVADPWHFGKDPNLDPAIFVSDLPVINIFCLLGTFLRYITKFIKDKRVIKKSQNNRNQGFSYYFAWWWKDLDLNLWLNDPDLRNWFHACFCLHTLLLRLISYRWVTYPYLFYLKTQLQVSQVRGGYRYPIFLFLTLHMKRKRHSIAVLWIFLSDPDLRIRNPELRIRIQYVVKYERVPSIIIKYRIELFLKFLWIIDQW